MHDTLLYEFNSILLISRRKMIMIIILHSLSSKYEYFDILNGIFFIDQVDLAILVLTCIWNVLDSNLG
jgi:hypothetical protein